MRKFKILLFLLLCQIIFGQNVGEKILHGKIIVDSVTAGGVTVINLVNEKSTVSNNFGEFYILAKADDLLVFNSINLEYYRRQIKEEDLKPYVIIIKMTSKITELKEVIVNKHTEINAVALGISPKGIKKYTPAERRLKTAGDFKPIQLLGIFGGSMPVDPILNAISGRTTMLKKELEVEKKERLLTLFGALYGDDTYFTKTLKIPEDYIKGFQYYCIGNKKFTEVLITKNKTQIEFFIVPLAYNYNEIIFDKNQKLGTN